MSSDGPSTAREPTQDGAYSDATAPSALPRWGVAGVIGAVLVAGLVVLTLPAGASGNRASADLIDSSGNPAGTVRFTQLRSGTLRVEADLDRGLDRFHGFHVHAGPGCRGEEGLPDFSVAAGHYHGAGAHQHSDHGRHAGDLPSLLARAGGGASLTFETDRLTVEEIVGRTVVVHDGPDNFANIPSRYAPEGPDDTTLATGDSGGRRFCGEIRAGGRG